MKTIRGIKYKHHKNQDKYRQKCSLNLIWAIWKQIELNGQWTCFLWLLFSSFATTLNATISLPPQLSTPHSTPPHFEADRSLLIVATHCLYGLFPSFRLIKFSQTRNVDVWSCPFVSYQWCKRQLECLDRFWRWLVEYHKYLMCNGHSTSSQCHRNI